MRALFVVILMSIFMFGCNHTSNQAIPAGKQDSFYGTYAFVCPCQTKLSNEGTQKSLGGEIAVALASSMVKVGIDWVGKALQSASEDDISKTIAQTNITSLSRIFELNENDISDTNVCLQIIRGRLKYVKGESEEDGKYYANYFSAIPSKKTIAKLEMVEGTEELFIELYPIREKGVMAFTPLEIRYSGYTPSDRLSKKPRDLAIYVGYSKSDKDVAAGKFTGRLLNFGTLNPKDDKNASIKYVTEEGHLSLINQTQWIALPDLKKDEPVTLAVNVIETRKANQLVKFLAEAFKGSQKEIKEVAAEAVAELDIFKTSKELEKEKAAAELKLIEQEKEYLDAMASVLTKEQKLLELCNKPDETTEAAIYSAQKDLYIAKKKANLQADSLGKTRPYSEADIKEPNGQCQ